MCIKKCIFSIQVCPVKKVFSIQNDAHRVYNFDDREKVGIDSYCSLRNVKIDKQLMELLRIVKVQSVC